MDRSRRPGSGAGPASDPARSPVATPGKKTLVQSRYGSAPGRTVQRQENQTVEVKETKGGGTHTVIKGETLWAIAQAVYGHGRHWRKIHRANSLPDPNLIVVGTVLSLPVVESVIGEVSPAEDALQMSLPREEGVCSDPAIEVATAVDMLFSQGQDQRALSLLSEQDPGALATCVVAMGTDLAKYALEQAFHSARFTLFEQLELLVYPQVINVGAERVKVASFSEDQEVRRIIPALESEYGVRVDSAAGVAATLAHYDKVDKATAAKIKAGVWEYKELAALERALSHFAPLLGDNRKESTRKGDAQEIQIVSKLNQGLKGHATPVLDTTMLGQYFEASHAFVMTDRGTNSSVDFSDTHKQLEGTAIHEIAHGVFKKQLSDWIAKLDYWDTKKTKSGKTGAEKPITPYGRKNASEDLSEAVMYYYVEHATLVTKCPERIKLIDAMVKAFKPELVGKLKTKVGS